MVFDISTHTYPYDFKKGILWADEVDPEKEPKPSAHEKKSNRFAILQHIESK